MKIYLVPGMDLIRIEALLANKIKDAMISFIYFKTPDKRNIHEKIWEVGKKEEIKEEIKKLIAGFDSIMVDSGAFSYMSGTIKDKDKEKSLDKYVKEYGNWLTENKGVYQYFYEMDVDSITGIKKVEEYREFLEKCAGRQSIPVWHDVRGMEYWKKMVRDYKYVAIGGIVSGEFKNKSLELRLMLMVEYAHEYGCKVHGLGYTRTKFLPYIDFDSVDSSSWLSGSRHGHLFLYLDKELKTIELSSINKNSRLHYREFDIINIKAWKLYIDYMDRYWEAQNR